jgi:His-Xaa-Ser system protein HxsD
MDNPHDPVVVDGPDRLLRVDLGVYTLDALLRSAYRATGKAYLHLQREGDSMVVVRMRPKNKSTNPDDLIREFLNDVLDQRLRRLISDETSTTRELIMAHALSKTNLVLPGLVDLDPKMDPLNVSRPDQKTPV